MQTSHEPTPAASTSSEGDEDVQHAHDVLGAFNAGDVIDKPGEPAVEDQSPTSDSDAPAPG